LRLALPLLLLATCALAAERPTPATLRKAYLANQQSVVRIEGGLKKKKRSGPGVIVSREGHIVTSVDYVSLDSATVFIGDEAIPVDVIVADARLKLAVVKPRAGEYQSSAVNAELKLQANDWLVAVGRTKDNRFDPKAGQVLKVSALFFETDIFLPAGTPLYDPKGRLVAVLVTNKGRALPIGAVKLKLSEAMRVSADSAP
jgi:hypothetical protein